MHLGDMVTVDKRKFHLKPELLTPLHIKNNSKVYGLFYPPELSRIDNRFERFVCPIDFMFTPIPPRLWYSVAKFTIYVNHYPGCIAAISNLLQRNNINIITAESTRSGHRCIYLTLTLEFVSLSDDTDQAIYGQATGDNSFIERQINLNLEIDKTVKLIKKEGEPYIFNPVHGEDIYGGVDAHAVKSLHYFYDKVALLKGDHRIFKADVVKNVINIGVSDWHQIFEGKDEEQIPTYGFAATSTRDLSIRVSLIPKKDLMHFKKFEAKYTRVNGKTDESTSKGVMYFVTSQLANYNYNIWSLNNSTSLNTPWSEHGKLEIIAQDVNRLNKEYEHSVSIYKEYKKGKQLPKCISINPLKASKHIRSPIFVSIRSRDDNSSRYLSKLCEAGKKFGLLEQDFIFFDSSKSTKESIISDIIETMKDCKSMIQVHNPESKSDKIASVWLQAECLLAQSFNMSYYILVHSSLKNDLSIELDHTYEFSDSLKTRDFEKAIQSVIEQDEGKLVY